MERHYKINGQDHEWAERVLRKHLRPVFGLCRAAKVRYETVERYIEQRQAEGAANATINRELSLLHRAFTLGKEAGRVTVVPSLPKKLKENNVRKGFCERDQFVAVRSALPPDIKPVVTFAHWTRCRKGEILSLVWRQVDWAERVVRLEPGETKNDDSERPGNKHAKVAGVIDDAGDPARVFHDLRRTGVRNLIRAGVPERVAMTISGHKIRSVFDRYNIVSERDLHQASSRLNVYISQLDSRTSGDKTVTATVLEENQLGDGSTCKLLN